MKNSSSDVLKYTKDTLDNQIKKLEKQFKTLETLKERKQTLEALKQQGNPHSASQSMKEFIETNLSGQLISIDKKLEKEDGLKKTIKHLKALSNQVK